MLTFRRLNKTILIILILIILRIPNIYAFNYNFDVYLKLKGLPTEETEEVYQDKEGYIWVATRNGLCRYDGYEVKTYKSDVYSPELFVSNYINTIAEDNKHNLWIGTSNGLVVFDKKTGIFRKINHNKLRNNNIQSLLITGKNDIWIGTAGGLHRYIAEKDSFLVFTEQNTGYTLLGNDIKTLLEDHKGNIWIGTWANGLSRFDVVNSRFIPYPKVNQGNSVHVLFQDNNKNIWIGSWQYGLFRVDQPYQIANVRYVNYISDMNPNSLSDNIVYSLSQDPSTGYIWVGTRSGLSILTDINNPHSFQNYLPSNKNNSIPYNEVNSIIADRSGNMWIGTLGGGVMAVNTRKQEINLNSLNEIKNRLSTNSVRSLFVDNTRQIILGIGSYGLMLSEGDKYVYYKDHPDFRNISNMPTINKIIQSKKNGKIWIATDGEGIFVYDKKLHRDRVQNINTNNNSWLCNNCVFPLLEDSHGNIWAGTRTGLSIYNSDKLKGYSFTNLGQKSYDVSKFAVTAIQQENDTTIWLGTDYGIFQAKFNPKVPDRLFLKYYSVANKKLRSDKIKTIYKSDSGITFIGTDGSGLSYYNRSTDCFENLHKKFNLPGDLVNIITEDNSGNVWVATNSGLVRLKINIENMDLITSRLYTTVDGLQDNLFNKYALSKTGDGKLYFGGHKGFNDFLPEKLVGNTAPTPVVVTDIKIQNQSLNQITSKYRKKISEMSAEFTQRVVLSHRDNNFNIEFSALSFSNPEQNKYAYKLEGYDREWQYTDAERRFAYYNNLEPGKYYFRLKAANENGVWTERVNVIEFLILPAPWLSWWAYLFYIISIGIIIMIIFRTMKNRVELRNALKINQLEKDKIEELNHAKLQFFTNISHEFLTPLTIISATLDELKISFPQNNEFYNIMSGNINRLIRLLQQILEFRKAETGNLKLKVSKSDISLFVRNTVESFRPLMNKKKIHFSVMCDPEIILGYFDADKLDKIIFNLLSNASKYNKEGGFVQVNMSLSPDGKEVLITVKDNGEGISEIAMKNLFMRFYEGEYRRFNTTGTGIGLSLTKDLVELHKGDIRAESVVGQGTTFYLNIPITRESFDKDQIGDYSYISDMSLPVNGDENAVAFDENDPAKEHTLLLVEDNEELLQVLVKLLSIDYNILTSNNGLQAIKQLEKHDVTLIVSDVMMAEMDGVEMCRYLKNQEDYSHIPVLLLTAKDAEDDKIAAYEAGADGYINKPFNLSLLKAKIGSLIKARQKQALNFKNQFVPELHNMNYTSMDERFLQKAIDCVYRFIDDTDFDQQRFTEEMATSKSTLYKKLKSLTGLNTSQFINNIRLKAACALIKEKKKIRVSELAYAVGYNDPKYFSTCFKKEFGMIPSEYLEKILEHDIMKSENEN